MIYSNVDKAIRNQLQAAVPKVYISAIIDPIIRIGNITCLQLITHLHTTKTWNTTRQPPLKYYSHKSTMVLHLQQRSETHPQDPSSFASPIALWQRQADLMSQHVNGEPRQRLIKHGQFFQTHFNSAYSDNRLVETSGTAGYHGAANLATTLATTQATFIISELDIALALQVNITPSIASSMDISVITPGTGAPAARTY
jgi:hypothetical protein